MKWIWLTLIGLASLVAIIALVGSQLPRNHVASRTLRVRRPPQDVWPVVTQLMAASSVPVDIVENNPPRRLVSRVKATETMFGGTWTVTMMPPADSPAATGPAASTLTITEDGWVANPIFRFVSRFVVGHHATMDGMLKSVAKQLGEEPALFGE
jgi:hypothetical protein